MINIRVSRLYKNRVDEDQLALAVTRAINFQEVLPGDVDLSIIIENDKKLKDLNQNYLGIDAVTDVLSFTLNEKDPESERLYLGDVIISFPRAEEQSIRAGHKVMDELDLLAVHGVLHLLGYDHVAPSEKAKMWDAQAKILESINVVISIWPED